MSNKRSICGSIGDGAEVRCLATRTGEASRCQASDLVPEWRIMSTSKAAQITAANSASANFALPIPLHPPAAPAAVTLLARAKRALREADQEQSLTERFIRAYEAAHK